MDASSRVRDSLAQRRFPTIAATVDRLGTEIPTVPADTPVGTVDGMFRMDPALRAVAVQDGPRQLVLLTRRLVEIHLSGRLGYGRALNARRTAGQLLPEHRVVCRPGMSLDDAADLALGRPEEVRYDDLLMLGDEGPKVVSVSEIFEELARSFRHAAWHDDLTGLPNRRWFDEQGPALLARSNPDRTAILYIDLDHFKAVNDTHGHDVGNAVLVEFARRLRECVRVEDAAVRLGGDEFVALLADIDETDAENVADRVLAAALAPMNHGGHALQLSATIGLVMARDIAWDEELGPLDALLRHADGAMLTGKQLGKHRVQRLDGRAGDPFARLAQIRRRLLGALEDGTLSVRYEPILDLASSRCTSVQAVLHWDDPELGGVEPDEFLQAAERSGLLAQIASHVLDKVCVQVAEWRRAGHGWRVGLRVVPGWLTGGQLARDVKAALAAHGLGGDGVRIDVGGRFALADIANAKGQVTELRAAGVEVGLDSYGNEHGTIAVLRALPFTMLKITSTLIDQIDSSQTDAAIVAGIVNTGHALGLEVLASGVTRPSQIGVLRELGCDAARGALIGDPMAPDELVRRFSPVPSEPDAVGEVCLAGGVLRELGSDAARGALIGDPMAPDELVRRFSPVPSEPGAAGEVCLAGDSAPNVS
ncbi:putative bifunctional diguanylate cyclase/phosphodiesterase [Sinomonas albida]|uniref:putative bifunctional diguanylate cyclase/phosphodiesterase n=1 Tax=Sinomonas albida TaxID=369942 RepID=UPI0030171C50